MVIKRDGTTEQFNEDKIISAARKAVGKTKEKNVKYKCLVKFVREHTPTSDGKMRVEDIQDSIEKWLVKSNLYAAAKSFILYREAKKQQRSYIQRKVDFINTFVESDNAANATIDDNANVSSKNVSVLNSEIHKEENKNLNLYLWNKKIREMYPEIPKNQFYNDLDTVLYAHDTSSQVLEPYCLAVSMYPFITDGLSKLGGLSAKPKNIDSYCGMLINLIFKLSSEVKGAVAVPEALYFFTMFAKKEWGDYFHKRLDVEITQNSLRKLTIRKQIHQYFQNITYSINQPLGSRGSQAAFVNFSFFDRDFFNAMFGNMQLPEGHSPIEWEQFDCIQQMYMDWLNKERLKCMLTFPVCSYAVIVDEHREFRDKTTINFICKQYELGNSFFTYISDTPDSLSSCCRLRNAITTNEFSFTNGNIGVMTGSKNVITLNVNRIVQDFCAKSGRKFVSVGFMEELNQYVNTILERVYKYHNAYNELLRNAQKNKLFSVYDAGFIHLDRQYLTIGIAGLTAAAEYLNIDVNVNYKYKRFCNMLLANIKEQNQLHKTKHTMFNTEQVPAESAAIKQFDRDINDGYWTPQDINLYTSYMFKPYDEEITIFDKLELHGKFVNNSLDGGAACHINLDKHLDKKQYRLILDKAAKLQCSYLTFNVPNSECDNCGYITKTPISQCPKCKSTKISQYDRVIGYITKIKNWSKGRQDEQKLRSYNSNIKE